MKIIVFMIFFLLVSSGVKAQEKFLGIDKVPALASINLQNYQLVDTGKTSDNSLTFFHYRVSKLSEIFLYFNSDDICKLFAWTFSDKSALEASVEDLNRKFTNIGSYSWIDKDAKFKVSLKIGDDGFTLFYKEL